MKKLLLILMTLLSLCACSSNSDDTKTTATNCLQYEDKQLAITKVSMNDEAIFIVAGDYSLEIQNCDFKRNDKNYLSSFLTALAYLKYNDEDLCSWYECNNSSYVLIQSQGDRSFVEINISDGNKSIRGSFLGTVSELAKNPTTQPESILMLKEIAGAHTCGILFPEVENSNIVKDSIETKVSVTVRDSSYQISNFPVKLLAKYVKDEKCSKMISELPNQTLKGKLYPYDYASKFCYTVTENITFHNEKGDKYTLAFYGGYNTYASAGLSKDRKTFIIYITPSAIYMGSQIVDNALKSQTGTYGSVPYTIILRFLM